MTLARKYTPDFSAVSDMLAPTQVPESKVQVGSPWPPSESAAAQYPAGKLTRRNLPSLTGIRGIAALWVLVFHLCELFPTWLPSAGFARAGFRAVDLFFILSGFILMYVHREDFTTLRWSRSRAFYISRFLRIYPLNTVVLLSILGCLRTDPSFVAWAHTADPDAYSSLGFLQTLLLVNRWAHSKGEWNGPTWSLSLEVLGYLLFPLLAYGASRIRTGGQAAALSFVSLSLLLLFQLLTHTLFINEIGRLAAARMLLCFICGIFLCQLRSLASEAGRAAAFWTWLSIAAILASLAWSSAQPLIIFPFATLVWSLSFHDGQINRVLASSPIVFLGQISFALYLVHKPILEYFTYRFYTSAPHISSTARYAELAGSVFLAFVIAIIFHKLVEVPVHRLGRQLSRQSIRSL